jgi:uncharacterized membrane protein YcfT
MRHQWMDGLRGLAIVAVVLLHAELTGGPLPWLAEVNRLLEPFRMPLLMALSGMLLARSLAKGLRRHVVGKARFILWPYLVWATLDQAHVVLDRWAVGHPRPIDDPVHFLYDPASYLWFLAYLFCYHLLAAPLPPWLRTAGGPGLLLVAQMCEGELHRFVWLAGWFLVGDALARVAGPRVPVAVVAAAGRTRWGVLAVIGRQSIAFYACHLIVMVYAVRVVRELGVTDPGVGVVVAVAVPLGVGALLARLRRHPWVELLFSWPQVDSAAVTGRRAATSEVAHARI